MRAFFLILGLYAANTAPVCAQDYVPFLKNVENQLRERIDAVGSAELRAYMNQIQTVYPEGNIMPNAFATVDNGIPTIGIVPSWAALASYMAEISTLNLQENGAWLKCGEEYTSYVRVAYVEAATRAYHGQALSPIDPPEKIGGFCEGLDKKYPFSGIAKQRRDAELSMAIIFVYMHELGHHALGHVERISNGGSVNARAFFEATCYSRVREAEADKFAVRRLFDIGWGNIIFSTTVWEVMGATGSLDPSLEVLSDHPSFVTRMSSVFNEGRNYAAANGNPVSNELSTVIDELIDFHRRVEVALPPFKFPDAGSFECEM